MNDRLVLIAAAAGFACLAWAFWHYLGDDAFGAISTLMLIVVVADNIRMRRQLKGKRTP
jgi:hypothetical protein